MKTNKTSVRLIHINAQSDLLSVMELVPEHKAEKRLKDIRDGFLLMKSSLHEKKRLKQYDGDLDPKLVVKTCVFNPELPLR